MYQCANKNVDNHFWKVPRALYDIQMKISRAFLTSSENGAIRYVLKRSRWIIKRSTKPFKYVQDKGGWKANCDI